MIYRGLTEVNWKSIYLSDYIEEASGLIQFDTASALQFVQENQQRIREVAFDWSLIQSDVFHRREREIQSTFEQTINEHK